MIESLLGIFRSLLLLILLTETACVPCVFSQVEANRKAVKTVKPEYPALAEKMHITGAVKVAVIISPDGKVKSTRAVGGHPLLIPAATDAAKRWQFAPDGKETSQVIEFKFDDAER
ncbi:MAG TPA: energy transducer TonB [Candidatus Acidoferrales bacterium]|nr:energy transducer TonB [Candidatus Acidoferrales bacterium]